MLLGTAMAAAAGLYPSLETAAEGMQQGGRKRSPIRQHVNVSNATTPSS